MIALSVLMVFTTLAEFVPRRTGDSRLSAARHESALIGGSVAMWRPLEIFLYDWWRIRAEERLFERLAVMPLR